MSRFSGWNERRSTLEQERNFERLNVLHSLTDAWFKSIQMSQDTPHRLERMSAVTLNPNLWLFEKTRLDQLEPKLEDLAGAQEIEEFLRDLKETIWIIQASTLDNALSGSKSPDELLSVLQSTSWSHGKSCSERIWGGSGNFSFEDAFSALEGSSPYGKNAFLLERSSPRELSVIWKNSPLQNPVLSPSPVREELATLHEYWVKGFLYNLSRGATLRSDFTRLQSERHPRFILLSS